ncbi:hypothetical protein MSKU15_3110 [Komagataeibacter diospyri]|nr:hypothetical protein MSKU15_3110 [Komagataeibacter diospyri]
MRHVFFYRQASSVSCPSFAHGAHTVIRNCVKGLSFRHPAIMRKFLVKLFPESFEKQYLVEKRWRLDTFVIFIIAFFKKVPGYMAAG